MAKKFTWKLEITVDESWVADGFDLTNDEDRLDEIKGQLLPHALTHEIDVKILKAPKPAAILKAQGY